MPADNAKTNLTPTVLSRFNRSYMSRTNETSNYKAAPNIPTTNHTTAEMLPRIYRFQMS
jgi:hypothetical protein